MRARNANTTLPCARRAANPMDAYDRLPPALRRWLAQAALPWSARSARRAWAAALRDSGGDEAAALMRLDLIEATTLARDRAALPVSRATIR
jgi:hypothetical protein